MILIQVGMRAGTMECNSIGRMVNFIDEYPISLNMTALRPYPFAVKLMVTPFRGERLFIDNHIYDFPKFVGIHLAFFHQLKFFSERLCVNWFKHGLIVRIIPFKVFPHLIKGMKPLCGNLPSHHSSAFPNSGGGFGVGGMTLGAKRTVALIVKSIIIAGIRPKVCRWSKGKNNSSRRYFTGNINNQPVAGRNFNGLRNAHEVNIA
jgi:hypothetical protein